MRLLSWLFVGLFAVMVLALAGPAPGFAQEVEKPATVKIDKRKLLVQPRSKDGTVDSVSFFEDPVLWTRNQQQNFYAALSHTLRGIRSSSAAAATWTLMLVSFAYGIFHAAGPGHGKTVISTWLLATENDLRRGVMISFMSAMIQALTAIVVVTVILLLFSGLKSSAEAAANTLESASYGLFVVMGGYLVWTAFRQTALFARSTAAASHHTSTIHHFDDFSPQAAGSSHHDHGPDCSCGHAHMPEVQDLRGDWSWTKAFTLAVAVGIRPCMGALLVLISANLMGLYWAGVASAFAMALGTFITVSVIAAVAVYARKAASRLARRDGRWMTWLSFGLRLGGGGVIAGLGAIMFLASLGTSHVVM
jgi:nickel/cobalt exporter